MSSTGDDMMGDARPVVATGGSGNLGLYVFLVILLIGGVWLFSALRSGADETAMPITTPNPSLSANRISAPPPLALPAAEPLQPVQPAFVPPVAPQPQVIVREVMMPAPAPPPQPAPMPQPAPPAPAVVFDADRGVGQASVAEPRQDAPRVSASRLANPAMTIPQGTVIPAVLETALDSTRPGGARALVQRDIRSFDGSRVLIQRGSRLYGEYEAGISPGERRALINWTRLIRPDGVTIALDSPASDPLGRAGVEGDVNSRFFARFGGAILQSVLDIGVGVATSRASSDGVFVALPGSTQNVTQGDSQRVRPVLEIDHGTSVSVFVARDLDFSTVEG